MPTTLLVTMVQRDHRLNREAARIAFCFVAICLGGCTAKQDEALGTLEWDQVHGRAVVSQPIVEILAKEGDQVSEGQAILILDTRVQDAQVARLSASAEQARWELKQKETGYRDEEIATSVAESEAAQSMSKTRQMEYDREKDLFDRNASSARRIDVTANALAQAKAQERAANQQRKLLESGYRVEEIEQAKAGLGAAEAELNHAKEELQRFTVKAERAGVLDSLPFKLGDKPPLNAVISTILAGDRPWARVYVPQPWLSQVDKGVLVDIFVDGRDKPFTGRVRHVSSNASFTPYYTLSEDDRSRLSFVAEIDLVDDSATELPLGIPVRMKLRDSQQ